MSIADVLGLVLLLAVLFVALLVGRRLRLVRRGGVDVALRTRPGAGGRGWHLGVARYQGDEFAWYRVSSLRSGPDRVLVRKQFEITDRREPTMPESYAVPSGSVVLACRVADGEVELAMGRDTLTGFLSWLESAPPGSNVRRPS